MGVNFLLVGDSTGSEANFLSMPFVLYLSIVEYKVGILTVEATLLTFPLRSAFWFWHHLDCFSLYLIRYHHFILVHCRR